MILLPREAIWTSACVAGGDLCGWNPCAAPERATVPPCARRSEAPREYADDSSHALQDLHDF